MFVVCGSVCPVYFPMVLLRFVKILLCYLYIIMYHHHRLVCVRYWYINRFGRLPHKLSCVNRPASTTIASAVRKSQLTRRRGIYDYTAALSQRRQSLMLNKIKKCPGQKLCFRIAIVVCSCKSYD